MTAIKSFYSNPKPCQHLLDYKLKHGLKNYNLIQDFFRFSACGKIITDKSKSEMPRCNFCSGYRGRFFRCLICSSVTCWDHSLVHSESNGGHDISVDMERAELYCFTCCDQVYDPEFDCAAVSKHMMGLPRSENVGDVELGLSKRKILDLGPDLDSKCLKKMLLRRKKNSKSCFPLGLRGLNNLGNTCFMNCVLQALLHAPPLRDYFLSDRHNSEICQKNSVNPLCLPCDIDTIFSAVFSGDHTPYSPAKFLYSWWQHSENHASCEQQDAHEFFISVLDRIHNKLGRSILPDKDNVDCLCIAHRVFSGLLRSDVTCSSCGFTSSTYDPCVDISLELNAITSGATDITKPSRPNEINVASTLAGCLTLFTRPEKLGSDQKLYCENCHKKQDAVKQMSIKKLPLVLCLHIKRFTHSHIQKMSRKIDSHLQFPFSLDMKPYLSSSIVKQRFGNRILSFEGGDESDISSEYEIFAVVTHSGMLESGHYVTYLQLKDRWFKCDDAWITEVDERVVRASQCYLIFYVQKVLNHKGVVDLTCQPVSPLPGPFIPIAGCC